MILRQNSYQVSPPASREASIFSFAFEDAVGSSTGPKGEGGGGGRDTPGHPVIPRLDRCIDLEQIFRFQQND